MIMKKLLSVVLVMIMCITMASSAAAATITSEEPLVEVAQEDDTVTRASAYFASRAVWASDCDDSEIEFGFDLVCARRMNRLGATKIEVMRKSGSNWIPVETYEYTDSGMSYLYEKNCATKTEAVYFQGTSGKEYCARITVKAEDDDGYESVVMKTNTVTAHD